MICENCHRPIKAGAKFCSYCGTPVREAQTPNPPYGQNGNSAYQQNPPYGNSYNVPQKQTLNRSKDDADWYGHYGICTCCWHCSYYPDKLF